MTEPEALYVHLLFGLKDRNLGILEANFAQIVYSGLFALEAQWKLLVEDVELGRVNPDLKIGGDVRRSGKAKKKFFLAHTERYLLLADTFSSEVFPIR